MSYIGNTEKTWMAKNGSVAVALVWLTVSVIAVAAMYHLWWTRERALYMDKSVHAQRVEVFRRAGIGQDLLSAAERINGTWPLRSRYHAVGDENQLSYLKYLIIPRMPAGGTEFSIREMAGRVEIHPERPPASAFTGSGPVQRGLLFSFLLVCGLSLLLGKARILRGTWFPERMGLSVFILAILVMTSRFLLRESSPGFFCITAMGIVGWLLCGVPWTYTFLKGLHADRSGMARIQGGIGFRWNGTSAVRDLLPVVIAAFILIWSVLMSVIVVPDDWDAWAIWGAKAKILSLGQGALQDVTLFPLPDYPLLWPVVWAFSGWCAGGWEEHWSRAWGPVFMLLCAWQMGIVVRRLTGSPRAGLLTAVLFFSVPMVPLLSSWSYAEAPLWLMVACGFGRLLLWRKERENGHLLFAAIFAAAAAYTKNEGLFFSALCAVWLFLESPKRWYAILRSYVLPVSLLYLPWLLWVRGVLALGSHAFEGFRGDAGSMMTHAWTRLPVALKAVGNMWIDLRQWNIVVWLILILSVWHLCRGRGRAMELFVPLMMLGSYFIINVFHLEEIGLLMSSWNRLTVQTLPLFLMILGIRYLPAFSGDDRS